MRLLRAPTWTDPGKLLDLRKIPRPLRGLLTEINWQPPMRLILALDLGTEVHARTSDNERDVIAVSPRTARCRTASLSHHEPCWTVRLRCRFARLRHA